MEEKRFWGLNISGQMYRVKCIIRDREYLLFVDKELILSVPRDSEDPLSQQIFEEVQIGGLRCNFIVENGTVMLVIDGKVMLNMRETREKRIKPVIKNARFQMVLGAVSAAFALWQLTRGATLDRVALLLLFGAVMVGMGIYQLFKLNRQVKEAEALEEAEY